MLTERTPQRIKCEGSGPTTAKALGLEIPPTLLGRGESHAQSGLSVHSSAPSAFLAPMLSRSRSVVERSAPMPSCPVERNPRVERGSLNIARSVLFWPHSRSAVNIRILPALRAKPYPRCCRLEGATTCLVRLTFGNESFGSAFNTGYQAEQQSLTE